MSEKNEVLTYKGLPLVRKDNVVYYGSMEDDFILQMQILETTDLSDLKLATKVSAQLQKTAPDLRPKERIVKKGEFEGFYSALEVGSIWLTRSLKK